MKQLQVLLALFACAFLPLHAASLDDLTWATTNGEVTILDCNEADKVRHRQTHRSISQTHK
jgi:hypothetical protein